MRVLPAIFANFVLTVSALGFGTLLRSLFPKSFSTLDRVALTLLGGIGILGTVLFCVGQAWLTRPSIILVLVIGILLSAPDIMIAVRESRFRFATTSLPILPVVVVAIVFSVTAIGGLAEPVGDMNNDAIAYHYLAPKVWIRDALIRPVPDEVQTAFPVIVESHYAALMSLGGQRAPQFFAVISLISLLLIGASLGVRLGLDPSGAWWIAALVATMPAVYRGIYGGFIDAMMAAFVLAAARVGFDAEDLRHYALFGIFCGICMGTKYTGLIAWILLVICSFPILDSSRRATSRIAFKYVVYSCVIAVAVASPFYLRNWIFYGCPIYPPPPALLRFFSVRGAPPAVFLELQRAMLAATGGTGSSLRDFLLLPFNLTYHTANFRGAGGIGLSALALAPFGIVAHWRNPFAKRLLLFTFFQVIAWFVTAQVARYMLQTYAIGAIFGILGWGYVCRMGTKYARVVSVSVIAISILYGLFMIVPERLDDMHAALSSSFEAKRNYQETPREATFQFINNDPSVAKILILDRGIAAYYIDKPYIKPFGRWGEQTIRGGTDVVSVMAQLPSFRVTHILDSVSDSGSFYLGENPPNLKLVFQTNNERVYRIE
jgi:hypothetical protein